MSDANPGAANPRGLLRSAAVMTLMTVLSRLLGLVREMLRAILLGTSAASDAFGLASTIPNLFRRLFAEGAMTAAFVPVFSEHLHTRELSETRRFLARFTTFLSIAVTAFTVLAILVTPWLIDTFFAEEFGKVPGKVALTSALTQLMWPYLVLVTLAAVLQGVLNSYKIFAPSAFAPVLMNLGIIACAFVVTPFVQDPSYALVWGFLLGGVAQLLFQVPYLLKRTPMRLRFDFQFWRDPEVRRVLRIMVPGIFAAGIYQFNVFASQVIAASLEGGSIASLQYSLRLQELVLGVFVVSIAQVTLPSLSEHVAREEHSAARETMLYALRLIAFITLPATLVLVLLGDSLVASLFQFGAFDEESTRKTASALTYHALGLFFIGQARVLSQAFFARKDLKTPTKIALFDALVNVGLCIALSKVMGHAGIALASTLAAVLNSVLLHVYLSRQIGALGLGSIAPRLAKMALATLLSGGVIVACEVLLPLSELAAGWRVFWLLGILGLAAVSYLVLASALRINEFDTLLAALKRRFKRR